MVGLSIHSCAFVASVESSSLLTSILQLALKDTLAQPLSAPTSITKNSTKKILYVI